MHDPLGSGNTYLVDKAPTPLDQAIRGLLEQQEQEAADRAHEEAALARARAPMPAPEPRRVLLVLALDAAGTLVRVQGNCAARDVLDTTDRAGVDLGAAAVRTLELGALGALLGS